MNPTMQRAQIPLGIYKHYKGGLVRVLYTATHSETLETYAVYEALYDCRTHGKGSIWIRPLKMFKEKIEINGKKTKRFTLVKPREKRHS